MQFSRLPDWLKDFKSIAILLLGLIVVAETAMLVSGPTTSQPGAKDDPLSIAVTDVILDISQRRALTMEFSYPLGKGLEGEAANATALNVSPDLPGTWVWTGPYVLTYKAEEPFHLATNYAVSLKPETLLQPGQKFTGETVFSVKTGSFNVEDISLELYPAPGGPTLVTLEGTLRFNAPVDPETLLQAMTLTDPDSETPVDIAVLTGYRSREVQFRSAPLEKRPESRELTFTISGDMTPSGGNIALGQTIERSIEVVLDPVLRVTSVAPSNTGNVFDLGVRLSTSVDAERAREYLQVSPNTEYRLSADGSELTLHGDFLPGNNYVLRIQPGLQAIDGAKLDKEYVYSGTMPDLDPHAGFAQEGMFLSLKGAQTLNLSTVNTDNVNLTVDRVYRNNLFWLFADYGWSVFGEEFSLSELNRSLGNRLVEKTLKVSGKRNRSVETPVSLADYIDGQEPGFYRVGVTLPGSWWGLQRWVLVTDLGMVAKRGTDDLMVWVSSFSSLSPLSGVKITVRSDQNQILAQGLTDGQGLWRAKGLAEKMRDGRPFLITAELGKDFSFLLPDNFQLDTTGLDVGGRGLSEQGLTAFLYGERDIYRPGESLEGAAVVRDEHLSAPAPMPLTLRSIDPEGRDLGTRLLRSDAQGVAPFKLDVPSYALTGSYTLQLAAGGDMIGEYRYQVEEFVPDRIRVDIRSDSATAAPGKALGFNVDSRYLFGPPAAGLDVETRVNLLPLAFAPTGYGEYVFGDPEREFPATEIFVREGERLDDTGSKSFSVDIPQGLRPPAALEARITARVREQGGRGVLGAQGVPVHIYSRYPGLKSLEKYAYDPGEPVSFAFVNLTPEGTPTAGKLTATLFKDEWQTVVRRTPSGGYRYESNRDPRLLRTLDLDTTDGKGAFSFTPDEFGSYRVVLAAADGSASQVEFYCGGWGYSPWAMENPARIEILPDKEEYSTGETATFQLRTPFSGTALVTLESRSVLETRIVRVEGNTASVSFAVKSSYAPNVYVSAVLVRPASELEPGEAGRAFGAVPFYVDRASHLLNVNLDSPQEIKPGEEFQISAQTLPGSTVTIAAVDEGILQLIAQSTPNPFDFFYAKRRLDVTSYDIFSLLFPEPAVEGAASAGGGEMLAAMADYVRTEGINRVKPVTFWSGPLVADDQGRIIFKAQAPEGFQGALRIMAVAVNDKRFGSMNVQTRIKSPISATPTFPRFMALEETVLVPVTVRNDTDSERKITLHVTTEGPVSLDQESMELTIPAGLDQTVSFQIATGAQEGQCSFMVTAESGNERFRTKTEVPLRAAYPFQRTVLAGVMESEDVELPAADQGLIPDTVRRELHIGGLPMIRYAGELKELLRYPYGCAEQTVSQAFPLLYFGDLAQELAPELTSLGSDAMVQSAIHRLGAMRTNDGGFGFWPGSYDADPWVTIYTAHFLNEARRAGFSVDANLIDPALDYLRRIVWEQNPEKQSGLQRITYALYVLARAGTPDRGSMNFLRQQHLGKLDAQSGVLLASAFAAGGDTQAFNAILAKVGPEQKINRERGENLNSPVRNLALTLLALMDASPADTRIPGTVEQLSLLLDGAGSYTTQESALAFMALGAFFDRQRAQTPFSGQILSDGRVLGTFSNEQALHLRDLNNAAIRVKLDGPVAPGAVLYSLETRGVPTKTAYAPENKGLEIRQSLLDRDGNLQEGEIRQGDLLVLKVDVRSRSGDIPHLAIQTLLPTGLEVENPRLSTTEHPAWMADMPMDASYKDLRDDRVLLFGDLFPAADTPDNWRSQYILVRAVTAGTFTLPPVRAEAMYDPSVYAQGEAGKMEVIKDF